WFSKGISPGTFIFIASFMCGVIYSVSESPEQLICEYPDRVMWSTTYRYDDRGRRIECSTSMWALHTDHSIWEYDEHDNAIRTIHDDTVSGDLQADESGNLQRVSPKSFRREGRLEYKYDSHGNWTERVVSARYDVNPEFQRSNIDRRTIRYYSIHSAT